ncbi:MAG: DUF1559 domain-containing protein [Planctomycetaceae bacterium]
MSGLALAICVGVVSWVSAQPNAVATPKPESLLPANALIYASSDGGNGHEAGWEKTAAYKSVHESGLYQVVEKTLQSVRELAAQQGQEEAVRLVESAFKHVHDHGASLAVAADLTQQGPTGGITLILHKAAEFEPALSQLIRQSAGREIEFEEVEMGTRTVTVGMVPNTPGVELAWWVEGTHIVMTAGIRASATAVAIAEGKTPNITQHRLWDEYVTKQRDFEVTGQGWVDVAGIQKLVGGIPIPREGFDGSAPPVLVSDVLKMVGIDGLNAVVSQSGYKGEALWSETWIDAPAPRRRLLSLSDGRPMTMADLPPLPVGTTTFSAGRIQPTAAFDVILEIAHDAEKLIPEADGEVDAFIAKVREELGMNVRDELIDSLGNIICGYDDNRQGILGMGAGVVIEVKHPERLAKAMTKVLAAMERVSEGKAIVRQVPRHGRDMVMVEVPPSPFGQTYCIDGNWMVIGSPQVVEAFLLRVDGKLETWKPSNAHVTALAELPQEFGGITVSDPRGSIELIMGLLPMIVGAGEAAISQSGEFPPGFTLPFGIEDIPPAELISKPLFPNVVVAEVNEAGFHYTSRSAVPGIPFLGGGDAATTAAVVAVGVALLLPAVQAARQAARRAASTNNLRQMGLAMHNYEATHRHLPSGTIANEKLKPEERLSWIVDLLPMMDQGALGERIDRKSGWESDRNRQWAEISLPTLTNPATVVDDESEFPVTHYVGICGVGADAPTLAKNHKRAGIFGYDRTTSFRDILDGTSNTVMISEASGDYGSWMSGGKATLRSFTKKPYINGPDGIGGPYPGGCNMCIGDGSVRFISEDIDSEVMEALSTIAGGEAIGEF